MSPTDTPTPVVSERRSHRPFVITVVIAIVIVAVDQLSKWWAIENLSDGEVIPVIGDWIRFVLVYNPGAAFGLGTGYTWILAIVAVAAAVAVAWYAWKVKSLAWAIVLGMILGGAITHAGDRLFRAQDGERPSTAEQIGILPRQVQVPGTDVVLYSPTIAAQIPIAARRLSAASMFGRACATRSICDRRPAVMAARAAGV